MNTGPGAITVLITWMAACAALLLARAYERDQTRDGTESVTEDATTQPGGER